MSAPRVLIVEDDAALQMLLYEALDDAGYDVHVALPDDALYVGQEVQPAVVMIGGDRRGSFDSGWILGQVLRRELPQCALIMLASDIETLAEIGETPRGRVFQGGLRKPFSIAALIELIATSLG